MANITRIKAKDDGDSKKKEAHSSDEPAEITRKVTVKAKNSENKKYAESLMRRKKVFLFHFHIRHLASLIRGSTKL